MDPQIPGDPPAAAAAPDPQPDPDREPEAEPEPDLPAPNDPPAPNDDKERANLAAVGRRLHQRFDATAGTAAVDRALDEALHRFDGSRIRAFVPVLAERIAVDSLRAAPAAPSADPRGHVPPDGLPDGA
ncbi:three-helix bundle dimerization domain-containing protein [Kitasatospora sp. NPDC093679]|uniref:three-helix bundle dimerization domain-containing protein n=1 Tax=Kitasatospora sp. NPDC093679 TaxID=3154983 RepID=UPI003426B2A6